MKKNNTKFKWNDKHFIDNTILTHNTVHTMKNTNTTASRNHSASKCYHKFLLFRYHLFYAIEIRLCIESIHNTLFLVQILIQSLYRSAFSTQTLSCAIPIDSMFAAFTALGCDMNTQPKTTTNGIYDKINWNIERKKHIYKHIHTSQRTLAVVYIVRARLVVTFFVAMLRCVPTTIAVAITEAIAKSREKGPCNLPETELAMPTNIPKIFVRTKVYLVM